VSILGIGGKPKIAVGLAIPPKPPLGSLKQLVWASRAMRFDCLLLWDHLQDIFPSALWEKEFTWVAGENETPHELFDQQTLLGWLAGRAGGLTLGTAVTEPIRRHPVVIAQAMLTLAHLTKKAPILGIGSGEKENVEPYGLDFAYSVSRLEEALVVLRLCFDSPPGTPLNYDGRFFRLDNARVDLPAPKGRMPKIWVGALGPRMLELTGRYGDGWLPLGLLQPESYAEKLATVRSAATAAGRDPAAITPSYQPYVVVAPTHEEAKALLESRTIRFVGLLAPAESWTALGLTHPFGDSFRGIIDWLPENYTRPQLDEAIALVPTELSDAGLIWGTPSEVATRLKAFGDAGMRHVVPQTISAAISKKHALYSLRALRQIASELR